MKSLLIKVFYTCSILCLILGQCANNRGTIDTTPQDPDTGGTETPLTDDERIQLALDCFKAAQGFVLAYEKNQDIDDFNDAIENYRKYYNLLPTGSYAALALLSVAELYCNNGDFIAAKEELDILKVRYDLRGGYTEEIAYIEERIRNRQ